MGSRQRPQTKHNKHALQLSHEIGTAFIKVLVVLALARLDYEHVGAIPFTQSRLRDLSRGHTQAHTRRTIIMQPPSWAHTRTHTANRRRALREGPAEGAPAHTCPPRCQFMNASS